MKKLFFILLIAVLSLSLAACDVGGMISSVLGKTTEPPAEEIPNPSGLELAFGFTVEGVGESFVIGVGEFTGSELVIPDTYNDYPIVQISEKAFEANSFIESVKIPSSVSEISFNAFKDCSALREVYIPSSVTTIYGNAFQGCSVLSDIYYDGTICEWHSSVMTSAYWNVDTPAYTLHCTDADLVMGDISDDGYNRVATSIEFKSGVTEIIFDSLDWHITSVTIPASATSICNQAFYDCALIKDIYYGGTLEQWSALEKGADWDFGIPCYTVHCTDGNTVVTN